MNFKSQKMNFKFTFFYLVSNFACQAYLGSRAMFFYNLDYFFTQSFLLFRYKLSTHFCKPNVT